MKSILFKPFERYSEKVLLLVGISFTLLASYVAYTVNCRFDGVLDFHSTPGVLLQQPIIDNLINILSLTIFLYATAKYINKKTRLIDILTASIAARIPMYVLPFFNYSDILTNASKDVLESISSGAISEISSSSLVIVLVFSVIALLFLVWYIALLFNGFKVASNAKGTVPIILFAVAILLAEALSKYLLSVC